jgi:L-2-hydroxyglutarate oxidase LhgO
MDAETTIIGAGVVGLAVASILSEHHRGIFVVEKHTKFGQETSSRNSEVIHSGISYPPGSLKARLCVEGKKLLYEFCRRYDIGHKACGKLVVANGDEEERQLRTVLGISKKNGVDAVELIRAEGIMKLEPHVRATAALYYPTTGIIDSHGLMKQLESLAKIQGVDFAYGSEVKGIRKLPEGYEITLHDADGSVFSFTTRQVINSAGLEADHVAAMVGMNSPEYEIHFCKGEYFRVTGGKQKYISHLIYPVQKEHAVSLGIHATIDLGGQMKLGPSAFYLKERVVDYTVDPLHARAFYESSSHFLPFIEESDLIPDQAGIRPKLQKQGEPVRDWIIRNEEANGYPGWINLVGMESPALTSCLAIANEVQKIMK